ncbi:unnamed protein product [Staurois parvus]|uniref:Prolactin receptor n=1 Tax=Staurois parvus TaxID=386267 RepID=A0ABN9ALT5_9NEOB|nr:unnamed protein product [Staurois parvus]
MAECGDGDSSNGWPYSPPMSKNLKTPAVCGRPQSGMAECGDGGKAAKGGPVQGKPLRHSGPPGETA